MSGAAIPLASRIIAVTDAFDAMTCQRPYRPALSQEQAIAELRKHAGSQFDPELAERFAALVESAAFELAAPETAEATQQPTGC